MSGVLGIFENQETVLDALTHAKAQGFTSLEAFSPFLDEELIAQATPERSRVHWLTLAGAVTGAISGFALTIGTTLQWPILITGGKPIVSLPPFLVIVFTLTILLGSIATLAGFLYWAIGGRRRCPVPYDGRFSDGHFGLWVECGPSDVDTVVRLMQEKGAIEWQRH